MQSLRIGSRASCLSQEGLDQIRSFLNLSDQAMTKVRESRVLAALRFEFMDGRFHDITEAHEKTYDWIFESDCHVPNENEGDDRLVINSLKSPGGLQHVLTVLYSDVLQNMDQARLCFNTWLKDGDGIFHISGKPGAGKS